MPEPKSTRESLSKTPSWIMLGAVIGAAAGWSVKDYQISREREATEAQARATAAAAAKPAPAPAPVPKPEPTELSLSDMEAIFEKWQDKAMWRNELTEVVFWDRVSNQYKFPVEVQRNGDQYFYRTIPKLTRPLMEGYVPNDSPIKFTNPDISVSDRTMRFVLPAGQ